MATVKTSGLPAATSSSGSDLLIVTQSGTTTQMTRDVLLAAMPELIRDTIGTALVAGSNVQINVDDPNDKIYISATGGGSGTGGVTATVDGTAVGSLTFTSGVAALDVSAVPLPTGTPTVGQVAAVATVSPVTTAWTTPTGGGSSGSGFTSSTRLVVTSSVFGGKGDGVVLNDLTVSAGSKNISSASAPFTSTAVDAGKLVIWLTGATTEVGIVATVQSSTQATLVNAPVASSVAFGGPNTNGAVGTDNTGPINAALAAAQAAGKAVGGNRWLGTPIPEVHFPAGVYLTRALNAFTVPNGLITGEGMHATFIAAGVASGTLFTHGTFNSNAGNAYNDSSITSGGWAYRDLNFLDPCRRSSGTEGQRTVTAIQDNGNGGIRINNCWFTGLRYGFAGAYGSDFSDIRDSFFEVCDVGAYFGPGSQQVNVSKTDFTTSREGLVFEGAPQWHLGDGSSFEDNTVACVTIEGKSSGTTRFGLSPSIGGSFYSGNFIIDGGCWFETNSGGNGRISPRSIWFNGDGPYGIPCEGLTVRDAYLISGGTQVSGGSNCFVEHTSALVSDQAVIIDGLYCSDPSYINTVFKFSGTASTSKPLIKNVRKPASVSLTSGNVTAKVVNRNGTYSGFTSS